jgi:hypothetical protein
VPLPREVGAGRAGDGDLKLAVVHLRDGVGQRAGQGAGRRDGPGQAPLGGTGRRVDRADAEAQLVDHHAVLAQAGDEGGRQERQLRGPHARGRLHDEDAALDGDGLGAVGDAHAHGLAPHVLRDGRPGRGEAILPRPGDDPVDSLRDPEVRTPLSPLGHVREPSRLRLRETC